MKADWGEGENEANIPKQREDLVSYNYFAKYTEQTEGSNYFLVFEGTESPEHVIVYHQCKLQFQK